MDSKISLSDPRTLFIPDEEFKLMTPAQAQYWKIKAENMDIVLFFKMGKFYELFDEVLRKWNRVSQAVLFLFF